MHVVKRLSLAGLAILGIAFWNGAASAVTCDTTPVSTERVFTVTPSSSCVGSGSGNIDIDPSFNAFLTANAYVLLDKSDDALSGASPGLLTLSPATSGTSGTWQIGDGITNNTQFGSFILGLKSGEGNGDPDWGAFLLSGLSGTWSITDAVCPGNDCNGVQQLSHGNLYGQLSPVPLPSAVWLFGSGLMGLTLLRRRKTVIAVK